MFRNTYIFILALSLAAVLGAVSCKRGELEKKDETAADAARTGETVKTGEPATDGKKDDGLDAILSGYYKAIGGPEKWNTIKTIKYTGKMNSMGKIFLTAFVYKRPDQCRLDFSVGNIYFIQAYDGEQGWKFNPTAPGGKPERLEGEDLDDIRETCDFDGPLIDYEKKGHKVEYAGTENIEGRDGYKLKVTFNTGNVDYYYLDKDTYLPFLVKGTTKMDGKDTPSITHIGGYLETGGVLLPYDFKFDVEGADATEILKISTVEINPKLDETMFKFPRRVEDSY